MNPHLKDVDVSELENELGGNSLNEIKTQFVDKKNLMNDYKEMAISVNSTQQQARQRKKKSDLEAARQKKNENEKLEATELITNFNDSVENFLTNNGTKFGENIMLINNNCKEVYSPINIANVSLANNQVNNFKTIFDNLKTDENSKIERLQSKLNENNILLQTIESGIISGVNDFILQAKKIKNSISKANQNSKSKFASNISILKSMQNDFEDASENNTKFSEYVNASNTIKDEQILPDIYYLLKTAYLQKKYNGILTKLNQNTNTIKKQMYNENSLKKDILSQTSNKIKFLNNGFKQSNKVLTEIIETGKNKKQKQTNANLNNEKINFYNNNNNVSKKSQKINKNITNLKMKIKNFKIKLNTVYNTNKKKLLGNSKKLTKNIQTNLGSIINKSEKIKNRLSKATSLVSIKGNKNSNKNKINQLNKITIEVTNAKSQVNKSFGILNSIVKNNTSVKSSNNLNNSHKNIIKNVLSSAKNLNNLNTKYKQLKNNYKKYNFTKKTYINKKQNLILNETKIK